MTSMRFAKVCNYVTTMQLRSWAPWDRWNSPQVGRSSWSSTEWTRGTVPGQCINWGQRWQSCRQGSGVWHPKAFCSSSSGSGPSGTSRDREVWWLLWARGNSSAASFRPSGLRETSSDCTRFSRGHTSWTHNCSQSLRPWTGAGLGCMTPWSTSGPAFHFQTFSKVNFWMNIQSGNLIECNSLLQLEIVWPNFGSSSKLKSVQRNIEWYHFWFSNGMGQLSPSRV